MTQNRWKVCFTKIKPFLSSPQPLSVPVKMTETRKYSRLRIEQNKIEQTSSHWTVKVQEWKWEWKLGGGKHQVNTRAVWRASRWFMSRSELLLLCARHLQRLSCYCRPVFVSLHGCKQAAVQQSGRGCKWSCLIEFWFPGAWYRTRNWSRWKKGAASPGYSLHLTFLEYLSGWFMWERRKEALL